MLQKQIYVNLFCCNVLYFNLMCRMQLKSTVYLSTASLSELFLDELKTSYENLRITLQALNISKTAVISTFPHFVT